MSAIGQVSTVAPLDLFVGPYDLRLVNATDNPTTAGHTYAEAFQVNRPFVGSAVRYWGGSAPTGTVDLGIYADGTTNNRLAHSGAIAIAGAYTQANANLLAPVTLLPGIKYWVAVWVSDTSTLFAMTYGQIATGLALEINTGGSALPASLDTVSLTYTQCPPWWISVI